MMIIHLNNWGKTFLDIDIKERITPEAVQEPIIREALRNIDRVYKIEGLAMYTKEYGVLSPQDLSNGCKSLILLYLSSKEDIGFLISNCCMGENVLPYLAKLSLKYDFHISMDYPMLFGVNPVELSAMDFDTKKEFKNSRELAVFYRGRAGAY